jgi:4-aminobutyrate aminotransferase-like enzyme
VLRCLEKGVLVNQVTPSAVRLLPALTIPEEDLARGIDVLAESVEEVS